jgi:hypothetical protein
MVKGKTIEEAIEMIAKNWEKIKESIGPEIERIKEEIKPELENAKQEIKEHYKKTLADFMQRIRVTSKDNMTAYEVDTLSSREMLQYAKNHIVKGANMVAAFKQQGIINEKEVAFVYLSYGKGRELLADENNHYVIIKANKLEQDILNLFSESDLVILK